MKAAGAKVADYSQSKIDESTQVPHKLPVTLRHRVPGNGLDRAPTRTGAGSRRSCRISWKIEACGHTPALSLVKKSAGVQARQVCCAW